MILFLHDFVIQQVVPILYSNILELGMPMAKQAMIGTTHLFIVSRIFR